MRENRLHGSEGGAANARPYPYQKARLGVRKLAALGAAACFRGCPSCCTKPCSAILRIRRINLQLQWRALEPDHRRAVPD